ncbi:hypothetical protein Syun_023203 [Stephania yunnanensis]|uniref:Uncharacterized protein n=1 Tax=Stephania yunnanensis TaxID=152371 RepID=A0AAP0FH79_9MAGN
MIRIKPHMSKDREWISQRVEVSGEFRSTMTTSTTICSPTFMGPTGSIRVKVEEEDLQWWNHGRLEVKWVVAVGHSDGGYSDSGHGGGNDGSHGVGEVVMVDKKIDELVLDRYKRVRMGIDTDKAYRGGEWSDPNGGNIGWIFCMRDSDSYEDTVEG